jgi:hypothetical protein
MKYLTILLTLLLPMLAMSQDDDTPEQDPKAREKINAARVAYITERLGLTPAEAERFWPLYREYTDKQRALKQQFNQARKQGKPAEALLDLEQKLKQDGLNLEKEYSGRIRQTISPEKLLNLRRAEEDFRKLILQQLQQRQLNQQRRDLQRDRLQQRQQQRNN